MKKILILIPAYNEEESIGKVLEDIKHILSKRYEYHILVVDDGSSDKTREIVKQHDVEVISQIYNMGYGSALQLGYKFAVKYNFDYVMQIDADGQHDIENITRMEEEIEKENAPDILLGSRFLKDSATFRVPFIRRMVIAMFQIVIKMVSHIRITDPTTGLQCLNRKAFSYYSEYTNFDYRYPDINMIVQMCILGYQIGEFPAVMHTRKYGEAMHSGILKPINYMVIMTISTINAILRNKGIHCHGKK